MPKLGITSIWPKAAKKMNDEAAMPVPKINEALQREVEQKGPLHSHPLVWGPKRQRDTLGIPPRVPRQ